MANNRRAFVKGSVALASGSSLAGGLLWPAHAQQGDGLTMAFNVPLPSWDPTTGPSSVNPALQSIRARHSDPLGLERG